MEPISEQIIDQVTEILSVSEEALEEAIDSIKEKNDTLLGYFFSDNFREHYRI